MIKFLLKLFGRTPKPHVIEGWTPLSETDAGRLGASIMKGSCPDCSSQEGFYEGPSGGMSTNIFCKNPGCRQGFNFTNMFGEGHAQRIHKMAMPEGFLNRQPPA